jgi:alkaline phosphatase D
VLGLLAVLILPGCRLIGGADGPGAAADSATVLWSGGVTPTAARVVAHVPEAHGSPSESVRLALATRADLAGARRVAGRPPAPGAETTEFALEGLTPDTRYHYALEIGGRLDTARQGTFRTPADGPFSFRVALGSCAITGSNHRVFDAIRAADPQLLLHLGDMHYEDIAVADPAPFRRAYQKVHASPRQAALYRSVPLAYVWDDHDYGPNNSSRAAPGQNAAQRVYREYVPHYPLAEADADAPIHQAFTIGRVRFLVTDLRSARTENGRLAPAERTMMGDAQKAWFKEQLRRARDRYPVIAWVSSVPWIANDPDALDRWSGFAPERRELAAFIDSIGVADQLVMLSGDAHMTALDDGTHNEYGREGGGGFPVVHAGAFDRRGSVKGGPYTIGPFPNRLSLLGAADGQYVLMQVDDAGGDEVCVTWTGRRVPFNEPPARTLFEWTKCFPAGDGRA